MRIRLGIRTHFFDHCVKYAYDEWQKILGEDVFLLMDETRGIVEVNGLPKLSWTESDAEELGLPLMPERKVPWYNADYHMYHMLDRMQPNEFCFLIEHDLFIKISDRNRVLDLLRRCAEYDFVAPKIGDRLPSWRWTQNLGSLYESVKGALVMVVGFNRTSAEFLLARRLALNEGRILRDPTQWPFAEAFIGTELSSQHSLKVGDLMVLGGLTRDQVRTTPPFLFDDLVRNAPADVLYHPCLSRERFLPKLTSMFRRFRPDTRIWNALWPFVSTASEAEIARLDWLALNFWKTESFIASFPKSLTKAAALGPPDL